MRTKSSASMKSSRGNSNRYIIHWVVTDTNLSSSICSTSIGFWNAHMCHFHKFRLEQGIGLEGIQVAVDPL